MNQPKLLHLFCALVIVSLLQVAAAAQNAELRGHVLLKQADGATVPVGGAIVDVFRVDLLGHFIIKTAANGEFVALLPINAVYLIAASSPGAKPQAIENAKAGRGIEHEFLLEPGDGARLTREEAKVSVRVTAKTALEIISRTFSEGNDAMRLHKYDEAIKLYDEALAAALPYPEVMPAILVNRSMVQSNRGIETYTTATDAHNEAKNSAQLESASSDFREAAESASRAIAIIKAQTIPEDEAGRAQQRTYKLFALRARATAMRLVVVKVDPTQAAAGLAAFLEYIDAEDDPLEKSRAELNAGSMLLEAKQPNSAIEQYRRILVSDPQNLEAIFGYGISLYRSGERARFPEAALYLQSFLNLASGADPLRQVAAEALEKLKALK